MRAQPRLRHLSGAVAGLFVLVSVVTLALAAPANATTLTGAAPLVAGTATKPTLHDSLRGRSRKLRARFVNPTRTGALPKLQ